MRQQKQLTGEETVTEIAENPYIQYFLGLKEFWDEPLFDVSMMVHFRKRFPVEELAKINEYICTGKRPKEAQAAKDDDDSSDNPPTGSDEGGKWFQAGKPNKNTSKKKQKWQKNRGKLLMDATVAPRTSSTPQI